MRRFELERRRKGGAAGAGREAHRQALSAAIVLARPQWPVTPPGPA